MILTSPVRTVIDAILLVTSGSAEQGMHVLELLLINFPNMKHTYTDD